MNKIIKFIELRNKLDDIASPVQQKFLTSFIDTGIFSPPPCSQMTGYFCPPALGTRGTLARG
ncbi:MAG TPA: hypothetical protein DEG17_10525 [Cyanobacteria bacterium UBA11149]|nr:hypothetical protein [Cyanobacteria bacterium UBA11367]HBE58513.1 hypothetical protein [Cyanobacteria bacterium UBA11366]HBK66574.1 hypothetical protein [Cyanobacteria bacterium UBA11166]HBR72935.1 hypothetical protein [Cyanobacteria bacterium UBA11159]HBS70916.1 hypothetical protein [Cyanobacteria bacterium UBA11153]HBW89284.1 hypothetical protein [Cyanobacteria bacterium UBA11149]HCA97432.1 hypothetical protein [Cyanobacteria bacterium UBA9226]